MQPSKAEFMRSARVKTDAPMAFDLRALLDDEILWLSRIDHRKPKDRTAFTNFQKLPFEIQLDIWELVVPKPELINFQDHKWDGPLRTGPYPAMLHLCRSSRDIILRHYHHMIVELHIWRSCRTSSSLALRPPRTLIFAPNLDTIYLSRHKNYNPFALVQNGEDELKLKKFIVSLGDVSVRRVAISMALIRDINPWGIGTELKDQLLHILLYHRTIREIIFVAKGNDLRSRDTADHCAFSIQSYLAVAQHARDVWWLGRGDRFLTCHWPSANPLVLGHRPLEEAKNWWPPIVCAFAEDRLLELFN
jgi:hypothetical protein